MRKSTVEQILALFLPIVPLFLWHTSRLHFSERDSCWVALSPDNNGYWLFPYLLQLQAGLPAVLLNVLHVFGAYCTTLLQNT